MEEKIDQILLANFTEGDWQTAQKELLLLFNVSRSSTEEELLECSNCGEKVKMVSSGEFCPCCFC